ncbi:uncharacterized protein LOC142802829 [Rhipicephalus microplus]|uniref:uncharacterized protein LOC142802829 n=1 Tax=Rhipicephalus microplus TaxID=6941 RepID=UPI003F6A98C6
MIKNVFPHTWDYINCLYQTPILTGVSAASAGVGLATDFMLLQAVKFGAVKPRTATPDPVPPNFYSTMLYAICMKMFLITFDFIDNMVAFYTCMQDFLLKKASGGQDKWQDYLKHPPHSDPLKDAVIFLWYTVNFTAILTAAKGVALFLIYDFYEGVKQQGTLLASGLVDSLPEREVGSSPKQVVPIDEHGEAVGDTLLEESPENHALPSGDTIDSRTTDKSTNPA